MSKFMGIVAALLWAVAPVGAPLATAGEAGRQAAERSVCDAYGPGCPTL